MGVFLNEALIFHFSADVDPRSVTPESITIRPLPKQGADSRSTAKPSVANGRFDISGTRVRFLPKLGTARDLTDGGLLPGTRYEVLMRGFPSPDGLRSIDGLPLGVSSRMVFETAELTEPRQQIFDDTTPVVGQPLRLDTRKLGRSKSVTLRCAEPIDPSTLEDGEFHLVNPEGGETVRLEPRLIENDRVTGAKLELRPERRLTAGVYAFPADLVVSVRDYGSNPVWYPSLIIGDQIQVLEEDERQTEYTEDFLGDDSLNRRSPLPVPDSDGSASWIGDGRVTIRFPAAAGSGADGTCRLTGTDGRTDIHATRLSVVEGEQVELLSAPGLVTLRAQGTLSVKGSITRRCGRESEVTHARGETLSSWLQRAREVDAPWTVLIAGGDLVIDDLGSLDVDGPLVLVAGGSIRITGRVRAQERQLWRLGEGGGFRSDQPASPLDLELDPPYLNPLREPLTFRLLSQISPSGGGVERWIPAVVSKMDGSGLARVLFLPADLPLTMPLDTWGAVDDPTRLESKGALRLLFELRVDPPVRQSRKLPLWDPPVIDSVTLKWEPIEGR